MLKILGVILVCIFIGVGVFSFSKALVLFRDNESLSGDINSNYKPRLAKLEGENSSIKKALAKTKDSLVDLESRNKMVEAMINEKNEEIKGLRGTIEKNKANSTKNSEGYNALLRENQLLKDKINSMFSEFSKMKEAFSSVDELQERLEYLKGNKKGARRSSLSGEKSSRSGNGGFLVKNGKSTHVPGYKVHVRPVEG
ncbi:hypothetical protein ACFL96_16265 [Thermoproteota archaeon]